MFTIYHDLEISAPPEKVFHAVSSPAGLNAWWTLQCEGKPNPGVTYRLYFAPEYDWTATVQDSEPNKLFSLRMDRSDEDWTNTRLVFSLAEDHESTRLRFEHAGWPRLNEHFRRSSYFWALYLRLLKRYLEQGEVVPYDLRSR